MVNKRSLLHEKTGEAEPVDNGQETEDDDVDEDEEASTKELSVKPKHTTRPGGIFVEVKS